MCASEEASESPTRDGQTENRNSRMSPSFTLQSFPSSPTRTFLFRVHGEIDHQVQQDEGLVQEGVETRTTVAHVIQEVQPLLLRNLQQFQFQPSVYGEKRRAGVLWGASGRFLGGYPVAGAVAHRHQGLQGDQGEGGGQVEKVHPPGIEGGGGNIGEGHRAWTAPKGFQCFARKSSQGSGTPTVRGFPVLTPVEPYMARKRVERPQPGAPDRAICIPALLLVNTRALSPSWLSTTTRRYLGMPRWWRLRASDSEGGTPAREPARGQLPSPAGPKPLPR